MKHLKLFPTDADYQVSVPNVVTPNVSFVENDDKVYYHPYVKPLTYVGCFPKRDIQPESYIPSEPGISVTVLDSDKHSVGDYILVPEDGVHCVFYNTNDYPMIVGFSSEFDDGPLYVLQPQQEIDIKLQHNAYGSLYAEGPDGTSGQFSSGSDVVQLPNGLQMNCQYPMMVIRNAVERTFSYTSEVEMNIGYDLDGQRVVMHEFADGIGKFVLATYWPYIPSIFANNPNITSVGIPSLIDHITLDNFNQSTNLTTLQYDGSKQQWKDVGDNSLIYPPTEGDSVIERIICNDGTIYLCYGYAEHQLISTNPNILIKVDTKEENIVGQAYGNNIVKIPKEGVDITVTNTSDKPINFKITNEFHDFDYVTIEPHQAVIYRLDNHFIITPNGDYCGTSSTTYETNEGHEIIVITTFIETEDVES